jgi:hypothetical protein
VLYGVVQKYGDFNGGHYNCHVKCLDDGRWYHCNDSDVTPIPQKQLHEKLISNVSFALFYRKKGMEITSQEIYNRTQIPRDTKYDHKLP